ncbi:1-acylglycerol-3-phosphate O [Macrolepiota fuliginosa MF-IS2]|uniref:1-acyl-sn-glycerol-3-phosphate acyltransferase n=1 Tax=Macrolepiota fuliginosa MF-IS2 TaxID=1400762 RepID=A0A9P5XGV3_9AGAR|nr:1-acylglycerol-3-phosphate O [Macrolepiota fuliginosa MF-IS2]
MGLFSSIFKPLAYLSLPVFLFGSISAASPKGQYYTRVFIYLGTLAGVATASIATAAALTILGRPHDVNYYVAGMFYTLASKFLDLKVEVEGEEHLDNKPAVILCNHQSVVDILIIGRTMRKGTSMLAKQSLKFSPVGPFMMLSGAIFVDRGNNEKAIGSLKAATDMMKRLKVSLFMYPEGTRHLGPEVDLLPFKKGAFHMAVQAGIPIVPMVTENYWHIYRKGFFGTGVIKVRVLPPIPTEGLTTADINDLMKRVRDQMLEALREISEHARKPVITEEKEKGALLDQASEKEQHSFSGANIAANPPTPPVESGADDQKLDESKGSSVSLASSVASSAASEAGGETEEDEGMVLVGRPGQR